MLPSHKAEVTVESYVAMPETRALEVDAVQQADARKHDGSKSSNKAERDCKEWLIACAKTYPKKHPNGTKFKVLKVAKSKFPGLSDNGFERVWAEVVRDRDYPVDWSKAGRRQKDA